ncbi:MAG: DUF5665 domain-containing protein [Peptococcaceae bacterium]|jgi:hypothetical protein|nr:DUF5665 domain-containing protein [Peptococcaceae bacterium]MDH7524308.1 DUF5665 domain-containing protein [Peptococcaceae bacterium]
MGDLENRIRQLAEAMEKMKMAEYMEYLNNTKRMLAINFIAGLARGLGMAVGFTILGAFVVYFLQKLVLLNLPVIGDFIANIVKLVTYSLEK